MPTSLILIGSTFVNEREILTLKQVDNGVRVTFRNGDVLNLAMSPDEYEALRFRLTE